MGVAVGFAVRPLLPARGRLPLLVEATEPNTSLLAVFDELNELVDEHLLRDYTREEFDTLNGYIDHWRDLNFSYAAVKQLEGKYLVQNRVTKKIYESPQFLYILVAMCLFANYKGQARLDYIPVPAGGLVRRTIRVFSVRAGFSRTAWRFTSSDG